MKRILIVEDDKLLNKTLVYNLASDGYELGAVDYITTPFSIGTLQRKISAMFALWEHHRLAKDIYGDGRLFLDFSEQTASLYGKPLTLSPMEFKMLNLFCQNPKQPLVDRIKAME